MHINYFHKFKKIKLFKTVWVQVNNKFKKKIINYNYVIFTYLILTNVQSEYLQLLLKE